MRYNRAKSETTINGQGFLLILSEIQNIFAIFIGSDILSP